MRQSSGQPLTVAGGVPWHDAESLGLRVLAGRRLRRRYRRAGVIVVASDVDADAGGAAIWLAWHADSPDSANQFCLFERVDGGWQHLGGGANSQELLLAGRPSASRSGPASMMTTLGSSAGRSRADRIAHGATAGPRRGGMGGMRDVPDGYRSHPSPGRHAADQGPRAWLRHRGVEGTALARVTHQAADRGLPRRWLPADRAHR